MTVAILIATYNGSAYLKDLLESIFNQSYKEIDVFVRDDGSTDGTQEILSQYNVTVVPSSERLGVKSSFSRLLDHAFHDSTADFFMFCDQDDVWLPNKVEKTLSKMISMNKQYGDLPLLVHTDLQVVDSKLNKIASSMWCYQKIDPSKNDFNRLFLQNTVTGCTAMINRRLAEVTLSFPDNAVVHDWWMALVASCFGKIGFLEEQTILYRQHEENVIGAQGFKRLALYKLLGVFIPRYRRQEATFLEANFRQARAFLDCFSSSMRADQRAAVLTFSEIKSLPFLKRRIFAFRSGFIKQGFLRNLFLFIRL